MADKPPPFFSTLIANRRRKKACGDRNRKLGNVSFCSARRALVGNEINKNKMGKQLNGEGSAAATHTHTQQNETKKKKRERNVRDK